MDHMDFVMQTQQRSSDSYDPVHPVPSPWATNSQNAPSYPWSAQNGGLPQPYNHLFPRPPNTVAADRIPLGQNGGILPPILNLPQMPSQDDVSDDVSSQPTIRNQALSHRVMPSALAMTSSGSGNHSLSHSHNHIHNHDHDRNNNIHFSHIHSHGQSYNGAFANNIPGARQLSNQPLNGLGMSSIGLVGQEITSPQHAQYTTSAGSTNNSFGHNFSSSSTSSFAPLPLQPFNMPPAQRSYLPVSTMTSRPLRDAPSPTRSSPPASATRRFHHPRQRRPLSSRNATSEQGREEEPTDEALLRHIQAVRGSVSTKMVASKKTLKSLKPIKIDDLPATERNCVICYNDYGVVNPEGTSETPLRLPSCGHVFGDNCIKKWFEDSDSCPYCRDKVHAEPKQQHGATARAFMSMMRAHGVALPAANSNNHDSMLARTWTSHSAVEENAPFTRHISTTSRRSPSDDAGERQRRIRARYDGANTRGLMPSMAMRDYPVIVGIPMSSPVSGGVSLEPGTHILPRMGGLSRTTRQHLDGDVQAAADTSAASQQTRASISASLMSPSAPSFQPQGVLVNQLSHPEQSFTDTATQNSTPDFQTLPRPHQGMPLNSAVNNEAASLPVIASSQQGHRSGSSAHRPW